MARLRRISSESFQSSSETHNFGRSNSTEPTTRKPTRTSPRKKQARPYSDRPEISSGNGETSPRLIPKVLPASGRVGRQIRLAPLNGRQGASALFQLYPSTASLRRPSRPLDPILSVHSEVSSQLNVEPSRSSEAPVCQPRGDEDVSVEESVWCGSDASSESSDEELLSPSKLVIPRKTASGLVEPRGDDRFDFTRALENLRIAEPPRLGSHKSDPPSEPIRPSSSSDKENDGGAILRFSPPRLYSPRRERTPDRPVTPPPASPSKGRLQSPSKSRAQRPAAQIRPSLDAFWNVETVNEWHDQYSPKKEWKSPRKLKFTAGDASSSPTSSPRKLQSPSKRTKAEIDAKRDWASRKHQVAEAFLAELDRTVTDGRVAELAASTGGIKFIWSKTLNSTAGRANWKRETTKTKELDGSTTVKQKHFASIELAEKVIDDEDRLLNVIAHEFCHLCNFMISGIKDQPHGRQFKEWGRKCTKAFSDRGVEVTTKHSYQIEYKYIWQCSNEDCAAEFKRHSKSIDPKRHTCGSCRNRLVQIKPVPRKDAGSTTGYAAYVKLHFAAVKASMPGSSHKQVMEAVGRQYRAEKAAPAAQSDRALGKSATSSSDAEEVSGSSLGEVENVARVLEFVTLDDD